MIVKFSDIGAVNAFHGWALKSAYNRVMSRGQYILGPEVEAFEESWAAYCGKRYAVGVGNCTDALSLILSAMGIGMGDTVIVPAHTCIATWMAVSAVGATPVPVDVSAASFNMEPAGLTSERIDLENPFSVKAVLAVHMYGHAADMDRLRCAASAYGLPLLVDAAQAHGIKGEHLGVAAAFSFYPTKNLGALGDAGAVVTDDEGLAKEIRRLRNLGSTAKDAHGSVGVNSRMDELQAAFLNAKLPGLDAANARRERNAQTYGFQLRANSVWHQCVIQRGDRAAFRRRMLERGIETMVHYPTPPHLQPCYAHLSYGRGYFPVAEALADSVVSLPCGPELSERQVRYVAECVSDSMVAA